MGLRGMSFFQLLQNLAGNVRETGVPSFLAVQKGLLVLRNLDIATIICWWSRDECSLGWPCGRWDTPLRLPRTSFFQLFQNLVGYIGKTEAPSALAIQQDLLVPRNLDIATMNDGLAGDVARRPG